MAIIRDSVRRSRRGTPSNGGGLIVTLVLSACATTVSEDELNTICANGRCTGGNQQTPEPDAGATAGSDTGGSTATAGTANGGTANNGGTTAGGGSTGGGGADDGGSNGGGSGGTAGEAGSGGSTAGGGAGGASGGTGGSGGGGAGGTSGGGAGGSGGTGGSGGSGGGGATVCPAKTSWTPSASSYCGELAACADPNGPYPPTLATDASATTRFSSGQTQAGGEWIQINLGASAALDGITIVTTNADWTREYEVRFAATANNIAAAPVVASGAGMAGTITVNFPSTTTGQYLRITQTGAVVAPDTNWWSIHDITIDCD